MLIEFSVSNFRSFRERQTLSMVAAPRLRKTENTLPAPTTSEKFPDLLRVAAVYGPNAAGKSNLVHALYAIGELADREPSAQPSPLPASPFRFDAILRDSPSRFEIHFIENGMRYSMEVATTPERIVEERLTAHPRGKAQLLYERRRSGDVEVYRFPGLEGGADLHETWRKATAPDVLFLSRAVANSNEELNQLRHPLRWLTRTLDVVLSGSMSVWQKSVQSMLARHPSMAEDVVSLLRDIDVPITSIRSEVLGAADANDDTASALPKTLGILSAMRSAPRRKTTLTHKTALGTADFDFAEESDGTKNLIGFSLPWGLLQATPSPYTTDVLVVDEFDSSLHPSIVAALVRRHIESKDAKQLIFTTHDTHLMDAKVLRRDQIWIVERDANGASQLYSIHDFKGRSEEDVEKRYFEGRYRGLPVLRGR